jgi:hypothetical protein
MDLVVSVVLASHRTANNQFVQREIAHVNWVLPEDEIIDTAYLNVAVKGDDTYISLIQK